MNKYKLNKFQKVLSLVFAISLLFTVATIAFSKNFNRERVQISGKVTQIRKERGKWVGNVTFRGKNRRGVKYRGSGTVVITFGRDKKVVRKMVITFDGRRGDKNVNGILKTNRRITFTNPVGSNFNFSKVMGSAEGNDI